MLTTRLVYALTGLLVLLKLTEEISWSWWAVFSALLIYEGLGFIYGFMSAFKRR
jgi:hypothetical protein